MQEANFVRKCFTEAKVLDTGESNNRNKNENQNKNKKNDNIQNDKDNRKPIFNTFPGDFKVAFCLSKPFIWKLEFNYV